ncbi:MAG TPA: outer membrane beta-barrel protein [Bryobacteraceae bacterium]|nr:outer membrane beta-barrel protein [Bryobacteraceae bacterium]
MSRGVIGWIVWLPLLVSCASAQQADTGGAIASISAGGLFGLGAHGSVDASVAAPVSKHFMPFIDFTYAPLTTYSYTYGLNDTGKALYRSYMLDVNGGIKIRFPAKKSDWVPYVGFGAGALHLWSNTNMSGFGATANVHTSHTELAGNASVGAIYYVTPHVGLGIEAKGYAAQHNRFAQATAGVFYQFQ